MVCFNAWYVFGFRMLAAGVEAIRRDDRWQPQQAERRDPPRGRDADPPRGHPAVPVVERVGGWL
jgi:hypothetical protein